MVDVRVVALALWVVFQLFSSGYLLYRVFKMIKEARREELERKN